ncbi:MAG: hypothetical protein Q9218_004256 [Villophora microphyllina]
MTAAIQRKRKSKEVDEREIARIVLIELLAHQFAFPVRWIDTQKTLFGRRDGVSRLVELGPAKVLGGMAKRTVEARYAARDTVRSVERQYLSCISDTKNLYFEYETATDSVPTSGKEAEQGSVQESMVKATPTKAPESTPLTKAIATASIADVPVSAKEIVLSLVANKLKKQAKVVQIAKSIKELTGGKSTLQNELLGDLGNEFGALPDGAEDMPIQTLGEGLESGFSGQLGKQSSSLVARLISSRMPAGFNLGAIREYLKINWGLGPGREAAVMLFAITAEPAARLSSATAAQEYFDSLTSQYAEATGIVLQAKGSGGGDRPAAAAVVDSAQLDALRKEQRDLTARQIRLLQVHIGADPDASQELGVLAAAQNKLQDRLDFWCAEFPDNFEAGIKSSFDVAKARRFDFSWNGVRESIMRLFSNFDNALKELQSGEFNNIMLHIANRADKATLTLLEAQFKAVMEKKEHHDSYRDFVGHCLEERLADQRKSQFQLRSHELIQNISAAANQPPVFKFLSTPMGPVTTISPQGLIEYRETARIAHLGATTYSQLVSGSRDSNEMSEKTPYVHLKTCHGTLWNLDSGKTEVLHKVLQQGVEMGLSFAGRDVLVTGAGPGSIGAELVRGLLMGGARVIVTTSRPPSSTASFYREMFNTHGARGSELLVIPCNQASKQDCESLINHIYSDNGLHRNLDAIIPFAAISESGAEIDDIGAASELAHRMMLVNVIRLLGSIIKHKHQQQLDTRPTQVLIPLSPNIGTFGGDGLYAESKLGLESLLHRFHSESWSDYLVICGAVVGWTRGTGLMEGNNIVAQNIESHNVLTFSQKEMAFNLLALMSAPVVRLCESGPILADLNGGLQYLPNLKDLMLVARSEITIQAEIRKAITNEDAREASMLQAPAAVVPATGRAIPKSTLKVGYPSLPDYEKDIRPLSQLEGMVDLSSVVVIVGFSELGPWGSSRTRWEMEQNGNLSQDGYIEMAWMMNFIKHFNGDLKGEHYVGWADTKTGERVGEAEIAERYGSAILEHSGIRLVEPELFGGYDPKKKEYLQEVAIEEDLPEFETSRASADAFQLRHGSNVVVRSIAGSEQVKVQIKRGAHISVPKAVPFDGEVAGQIPTKWDPLKFGIPEDIVQQVDPVTLYTLCCVSEALYSAGIEDSLEIFKHIHLSELGNFIGSSFGGMTKTRQMYKDRYLDKQVQGDVIQEGFANSPAAWVNMLLLGAAGPIKTPVGVCATGVESLDSASESILCGKTKMCLIGGTDDFQEDPSFGFGTMGATVNSRVEMSKGRDPKEMSRPTAESRAGFVESQGAGVQIITTAELALEMGLPIYGVVASSSMAADKITRSLPAPGQGILSFARGTPAVAASPLMSLDFRREQMKECLAMCRQRVDTNTPKGYGSGTWTPYSTDSEGSKQSGSMSPWSTVNLASDLSVATTRRLWGNEFRRQDMNISPLEASLAVWGLTVDDIAVVSLHGTSTKANDKNESEVIHKQMAHLRRTPGRPALAICQKFVTGHPKAPAATWMLNGCLQAMNTSTVPGNRNADNVDKALQRYDHLVYPTKTIYGKEINAFLVTSFGFGQKGGQVVGVAPKYLFATLGKAVFESYASTVSARTTSAGRAYIKALHSNSIFQARALPPYHARDETKVLMDPLARVSEDALNMLHYDIENLHPGMLVDSRPLDPRSPSPVKAATPDLCSTPFPRDTNLFEAASRAWVEQVTSSREKPHSSVTVGIDVEQLKQFSSDNQTFIDRNYTEAEQTLASQSVDPHSAFAGRWSAKEAVFKSLGVPSKGAGAPLKEIEILSDRGIPQVKLHGDALSAAREGGIHDIKISLSHSDDTVMAVALALRGGGEPLYI